MPLLPLPLAGEGRGKGMTALDLRRQALPRTLIPTFSRKREKGHAALLTPPPPAQGA